MNTYKLFKHLLEIHGVQLLENELLEVIDLCNEAQLTDSSQENAIKEVLLDYLTARQVELALPRIMVLVGQEKQGG